MNARDTCPAIFMMLAWRFFQDTDAGFGSVCGSILPVSNQGFPNWDDVTWRFGEAFASGYSPGTFGFSLREDTEKQHRNEENPNIVVEKEHRIAEYEAKGFHDAEGRRPCWTELEVLQKEARSSTRGEKREEVSTSRAEFLAKRRRILE